MVPWVRAGRTSVHRWRQMARGGPKALAARLHPGPRQRLTPTQHRQLERLLLKGATAHGWSTTRKTLTRRLG